MLSNIYYNVKNCTSFNFTHVEKFLENKKRTAYLRVLYLSVTCNYHKTGTTFSSDQLGVGTKKKNIEVPLTET